MSGWVRGRAGLVGAAVLALSVGVGVPAAFGIPSSDAVRSVSDVEGAPPEGFVSWDAAMAEQSRLVDVADAITASDREATGGGLGSIRLDLAGRGLDVFWKGQVSAAVQSVIDAAVGRGVGVTVRPAAYTGAELEAAAGSLMDRRDGAALRIVSAGPLSDSSGLAVGVSGSVSDATALPLIRDSQIPMLVSGDQQAGTPVERVAQASGDAVVSYQDRWTDLLPVYGGAHLSTKSGGCSTAFAFQRPEPGGSTYKRDIMLTAAHCLPDDPVGATVKVGATKAVVLDKLPYKDVAVLDMKALNTGLGRVWYGAYKGIGGLTVKDVKGAKGNYVNQYVCANGSYTGTSCNAIVDATGVVFDYGYGGGPVHGLVKASSTDGTSIAGNGDSGGSFFELAGDGSSVYAKGVFVAFSTAPHHLTGCKGAPASSTRECSKVVYYSSIYNALNLGWGSLVTAS
ncbi:hypothetical protein [Streptomyces sp. NPDC058701]|uniref:hypothetical protein n=1 Tax=Streptomyces sp. NPDC058701 TaxID=3346608 RepID=UPI00364B57F8